MQGHCLLAGLLLILMSVPFPGLAELKRLPTPGLDVKLAPRRVTEEVARNLHEPLEYGPLGTTELPKVSGVSPSNWSTTERECSPYSKDAKEGRLLEVFKEKHKADSACAWLAEARIERLQKQRPVSIIRKIPTIQLLDCATLTEEEVCKSFMCTWEAARCHETTASADPTTTAGAKPISNAEERAPGVPQ
jgi:hypothetical protein